MMYVVLSAHYIYVRIGERVSYIVQSRLFGLRLNPQSRDLIYMCESIYFSFAQSAYAHYI